MQAYSAPVIRYSREQLLSLRTNETSLPAVKEFNQIALMNVQRLIVSSDLFSSSSHTPLVTGFFAVPTASNVWLKRIVSLDERFLNLLGSREIDFFGAPLLESRFCSHSLKQEISEIAGGQLRLMPVITTDGDGSGKIELDLGMLVLPEGMLELVPDPLFIRPLKTQINWKLIAVVSGITAAICFIASSILFALPAFALVMATTLLTVTAIALTVFGVGSLGMSVFALYKHRQNLSTA